MDVYYEYYGRFRIEAFFFFFYSMARNEVYGKTRVWENNWVI